MRIIIAGTGKVGKSLTKILSEDDNDVTVIDVKTDVIEAVTNKYDVLGIVGNAANYDVQVEAKAANADLMIAVTNNDEVNILTCLVAKKIGTKHTIARIRNQEYAKQLRFMREDLGLSLVINPERSLAREISRVLRFPAALEVESFSKRRIELIGYKISEDSKLNNMALSSVFKTFDAKVLACVVARGEDTFIPAGDFVLLAGDTVYLTAQPRELEKFFRTLGVFKEKVHKAMIIGASKIGAYLTKELLDAGMQVKVIDADYNRCMELTEKLPKALVIHGDATDHEILMEEGIQYADAFVALSGLDETNMVLSMYATKNNVGKVVAKVNRKAFAAFAKEENLVETIVSTADVTTDIIAQYIRAMKNAKETKVKTLHRILDGRAEVLEFNVTKEVEFLEKPFKEIKLKKNVLIAGIVRKNGQIVIPNGDDFLTDGDDVLVVTTDKNLADLNDILR